MKRIIKISSLFLILLSFFTLISCTKKTTTTNLKKMVVGIETDTSKATINYGIGEDFTKEGLIINKVYDDNSKEEVKNYSLNSNSYNKSFPGDYDIIIKYSDNGTLYETKYTVTVYDTNTIISVSLNTEKTKVFYVPGEDIKEEDIVLDAIRKDETTEEIKGFTIDKGSFNKNLPGTYQIKVTLNYNKKVFTFDYNVTVGSIVNKMTHVIGLNVALRNKEFLLGSAYNTDELVVLAVYSNGETIDVTDKAVINSSKYNKDKVGVYEIIIEYSEYYELDGLSDTITVDSFYFARVVNELSKED